MCLSFILQIHTKKGLEVCRVTVLDTDCKVVYETMCLPTTDIIDYNTMYVYALDIAFDLFNDF